MKLVLHITPPGQEASPETRVFGSGDTLPPILDLGRITAAVLFGEFGVLIASPSRDLEIPDDGQWHEGEIAGHSIRARIEPEELS